MATNKDSGFATLTITLVLVSMLVAVSVFIGKVLISDKRITLNEIEYRVALAAAEKGIADAMALLKVDPTATSVSGSLSTSAASASYTVTMEQGVPIPDAWQLESVATLPNGGGTTVSVQVVERSILNPANAGPAAPLLVGGASTGISGNMTVVANPNGGGNGVPVSVWSGKDISGIGSMQTCHLSDYSSNDCTDTISVKTGGTVSFDSDVVDKDADFPTDLLSHVFGYGADEWDKLEAMATDIVSSCSNIDSPGFYIVDGGGECDIGSIPNTAAKSADEPVIALVKNANIKAAGGNYFYGLLFSYDSEPTTAPDYTVQLTGGAQIFGAISTNHGGDILNGTFDAVYDQQVMCNIGYCDDNSMGNGNNPFVNLMTIPGSWKDW
ncbi:pilus assembly PilX N-terminal domain-containing protein [Oceanimonas sp. CHS3-5]|uniref:pilus assembly PilX N-terminal domain-containing protein n=1 Tax=Oceanimonas sp. CHS3-5 TaxID=3068186 RepID=UPI00273E0A4D|nr:pilus assembly PilX N-terminal domain-containing protein [Oceanimonas sp. CHS3-5]